MLCRFAAAVLGDEGFENGENLFLLVARELGDGGKNLSRLTDGTGRCGASFGLRPSEQIIGGDVEGVREGVELIGSKGNGFTFPIGDDALSDARLGGQFLLSETGSLACGGNAATECRAFFG